MILAGSEDPYEVLREIAEKKHCLTKGGELDLEKTAALFLDDFRGGKLGKTDTGIPGRLQIRGEIHEARGT